MKDIVERLRKEAQNLSVRCLCEKKDCIICGSKHLLAEAANEIYELRSLREEK